MDYEYLLEEALKEIELKKINDTFTVKSLFPLEEWNSLANGEKRGFGSYFAHQYKEKKFSSIIRLDKKGTATYKKTK